MLVDYEKLYHTTFNALTDADRRLLEAMALVQRARDLIRGTQLECESIYSGDTDDDE